MIPLRDDNPSRTFAFINILLIITNLIFFLYQHLLSSGGPVSFFHRLGYIPYEFSHFVDIDPPSPIPIPLTILSAMFMHGGWIHLLSNMLFLWIFGDNVEDRFGHIKYLIFYIVCGIGASVTHIIMNLNSQVPSLGASGAIAGIMGAYMLFYPKARINTLIILVIFIQVVRIPAFIMIGYWLFIQVLSSFAESGGATGGGVAWSAHIGGFVVGFLLSLFIPKKRKTGRKKR